MDSDVDLLLQKLYIKRMYSSSTQYGYKICTKISIEVVLKVSLRVKIIDERIFLFVAKFVSKIFG